MWTTSPSARERLPAYLNAVGAHTADLGEATEQAAKLLGNAIRRAVLSFIDCFLAVAAGAIVCLLLVALIARPIALCGPFQWDEVPSAAQMTVQRI
jgi:hypothetical protein